MKKFGLSSGLALVVGLFLAAQGNDTLTRGLAYFHEYNYQAAIPYLQEASKSAPSNSDVWTSLAVSYQQLGRYAEAQQSLQQGLAAGAAQAPLLYNLGNLDLLQGKFDMAEENFSKAIASDPSQASPWLQRAILRTNGKKYSAAVEDYRQYLLVYPASPKRKSVEDMIAALTNVATAQKAEAEARQKAIDDLRNQLQADSDKTRSLNSGAGAAQGYTNSLKLDE